LKQLIVLLLLIILYPAIVYAQSVEIKSLKSYTTDNNTSFPVLTSSERLIIEFDVDAVYPPNLNVLFKFCDKNWNPTDNIFLQNHGKNVAYFLDYKNLPNTVEGANFYYRNIFPDRDEYVSFPFSGKWRFYIVDSQDQSKVFADGKFIVITDDMVELYPSVQNKEMDDKNYYPIDFGNVFWITVSFELPDGLFPNFVDHVEIIKNHKVDYPYIIDRSFTNNMRIYNWDANTKFSFTARDVFPGNEYRQVDLRDINKFTTSEVQAQFEGFETTRYFRSGRRDLNGSFILTKYDDPFSTYMDVKFSIQPASVPDGDVFLTGAFNDWVISSEYKMNQSAGIYSIIIPLKRGIYDYQYVVAQESYDGMANIDWLQLEGNNWGTVSEFTALLYYKDPDFGGYDRVIGYSRFTNR
jgi:hypothetical protein